MRNQSETLTRSLFYPNCGFLESDMPPVLLKSKTALNQDPLSPAQIIETVADFKPANISRERRYQTLIAAIECSFNSLLPDNLKNPDTVLSAIEVLKKQLNY